MTFQPPNRTDSTVTPISGETTTQERFDTKLDQLAMPPAPDGDPVYFVGEETVPLPIDLVMDADLTYAARIVWCYLRCKTLGPKNSNCISYRQIQSDMNINSPGSLSNWLLQLRLTRWIAVSRIAMPGNSRITRNIYYVFPVPGTVEDVQSLDSSYKEILLKSIDSTDRRIARLAKRVLDGTLCLKEATTGSTRLRRHYQVSSFEEKHEVTRWEGMLQRRVPGTPPTAPSMLPLDFHNDLDLFDQFAQMVASNSLGKLSPDYHQAYLDELAVRVLRGRLRMAEPVESPLKYLQWMVNHYVCEGVIVLSDQRKELPKLKDHWKKVTMQVTVDPLLTELKELQATMQHDQRLRDIEGWTSTMESIFQKNLKRITELKKQLGQGGADEIG